MATSVVHTGDFYFLKHKVKMINLASTQVSGYFF